MAQPFNLGNSFLGKSTIELVNPNINDSANNRTEISVDADGDLLFQRYKDGNPKGNLKFPVQTYGQSEKKNMHTDANGDIRFVDTWVTAQVGDDNNEESQTQPVELSPITGVEYLVIGGGGAGGTNTHYDQGSGGGGAGEFIEDSGITISTDYIAIGAGGSPALDSFSPGGNGKDTLLSNIIAIGGGGGQSRRQHENGLPQKGTDGGSGGGASMPSGSPPGSSIASIGSGHDGGSEALHSGGGGGGAGGRGSDASGSSGSGNATGGNGGPGKSSSITGTAVDYAGGGGGGSWKHLTVGSGGSGGGGAGNQDATGYGSGGGGGQGTDGGDARNIGGTGSDGIVVLAYPDTENALAYIDGNLAYSYSAPTGDAPKRSGYHVYEFIGGTGKISATETDPAFYSKELENACLFDGVNKLNKVYNQSLSNSMISFSLWLKLSQINSGGILFDRVIDNGGNIYSRFRLEDSGSLNYRAWDNARLTNAVSNNLFIDLNSWYHILITVTSQAKIYVNGVEVSYSQQTTESQTGDTLQAFNTTTFDKGNIATEIGSGFNCYMANIQMIDGAALDPDAFGTYREGVWIPKEYTGEYGTNGFHLDFSDANDLGKDVSGKNNHWT